MGENVDEQADEIYNGILGEIGLEYEMADPVSFLLYSKWLKKAVLMNNCII